MGDIADLYDYGYDGDQPREVTCNRCGKTGLEWDDSSGRWVLINEVGLPHKCNPSRLRAVVRDEFEDLDKV